MASGIEVVEPAETGVLGGLLPAQGRPSKGQFRLALRQQVGDLCRQEAARHAQALQRTRLLLGYSTLTVGGVAALTAIISGRPVAALVVAAWLAAELPGTLLTRDRSALLRAAPPARRGLVVVCAVGVVGVLSSRVGSRELLLAVILTAVGTGSRLVVGSDGVRQRLGLDSLCTVIAAGDREGIRPLIEEWEQLPGVVVVGAFVSGPREDDDTIAGVPVFGGLDGIGSFAQRVPISQVVVIPGETLDTGLLTRLQWDLEDSTAELTVLTPFLDTAPRRIRVTTVGRRSMLRVGTARPRGTSVAAKAAVERVIALLALVVATPVLALCMLAVRLDSRGPAIFRQTRVREGGRTFRMLKIRTMRTDAEQLQPQLATLNESDGGLFKIKADPRITRVGKVLRRASLDELPQLVNVLKGEMALIGPRPALPSEVVGYDQRDLRRLAVRPGLTGLWQVSGRSNLSWEDTIRLDIDYVDNWSPGRDAAIAFSTLRAVLSRDGAY